MLSLAARSISPAAVFYFTSDPHSRKPSHGPLVATSFCNHSASRILSPRCRYGAAGESLNPFYHFALTALHFYHINQNHKHRVEVTYTVSQGGKNMKAWGGKILLVSIVMLTTALFMTSLAGSIQNVQAAGEAKQYVQLNAGIPLADNLAALKGKTATVYLASGQSMTGIVKDVKDNVLHLEKISQKEFYDALVRVDLISAIDARVR
jgi:hypothetical protein